METKEQAVLQHARELHRVDPDWLTFFKSLLGLDGVIRQAFPELAEREAFAKTPEYQQIREMLADLRRRKDLLPNVDEQITVITVRLQKSLHDSLKVEAHEALMSMNGLCVAKLLRPLPESDVING